MFGQQLLGMMPLVFKFGAGTFTALFFTHVGEWCFRHVLVSKNPKKFPVIWVLLSGYAGGT